MFDFLKIEIIDKILADTLQSNTLLDFNTFVNDTTGELLVSIAEYRKLKFKVYPSGRIEIGGSLHYYWNDGLHNYNDFPISSVIVTVNDLRNKFNINPAAARIHNLEYGLNLITPFEPKAILKNLIGYKAKIFHQTEHISEGNYFFAQGSNQYLIKFYNKGYHFNQPKNILRFEKKVKKMECIRAGQIHLSDLVQPSFIKLCLDDLLRCFDDLIITEKLKPSSLSKPLRKLYYFCNDPRSWETMNPKQRHRNRILFRSLIRKHGTQQLQSITRELLIKKGNDLTDFPKLKKVGSDSLNILSKHPVIITGNDADKRSCQSCGNDISHQDKKSKFCSAKYVGYQKAHRCRNNNSNPRNNFNKKIETINSRGVLFAIEPFIKIIQK